MIGRRGVMYESHPFSLSHFYTPASLPFLGVKDCQRMSTG